MSRSRSILAAGAASRSSPTRRSPNSAARCARATGCSGDCAGAGVGGGGFFPRFRPRGFVAGPTNPLSRAPAGDEGEPLRARHGYAPVGDDELNRYYAAGGARAFTPRLTEGPKWYTDGP